MFPTPRRCSSSGVFYKKHQLTEALFIETDRYLDESGLRLREGSIIDATIVAAPTSTKNRDKARDPEMPSVRKGNQWFFGMRVHAGAAAELEAQFIVEGSPYVLETNNNL